MAFQPQQNDNAIGVEEACQFSLFVLKMLEWSHTKTMLNVEIFSTESHWMLSTIQSKCDRFGFVCKSIAYHITCMNYFIYIKIQTCDFGSSCVHILIENGNVTGKVELSIKS